MKKLLILLALSVGAFAAEPPKAVSVTITPLPVSVPPPGTNDTVGIEIRAAVEGGLNQVSTTHVANNVTISRFDAFFQGTELVKMELAPGLADLQYKWNRDGTDTDNKDFPLREAWAEYGKKLRSSYTLIPEAELYVDTAEWKFLGAARRGQSHEVISDLIFSNLSGKLKTVREELWIGKLPKANTTVMIASDGEGFTQVWKNADGEYSIPLSVLAVIRERDSEKAFTKVVSANEK